MSRAALFRVARAAVALGCVIALAGCRLDTTVDVKMQPDGSGEVRVVAVADAELVARATKNGAQSISDVLSFDDAVANGWVVSEPILGDAPTAGTTAPTGSTPTGSTPTGSTPAGSTPADSTPAASATAGSTAPATDPTPDLDDITVPPGGAAIVLTHKFAGRDELANVLNSIGPPLSAAAVGRTTEGDQTTNAVRGTLGITGGYDAFTDPDLVQAVHGVPFANELAASAPAQTMSFTYRIDLPGELINAGTGTAVGDGVIEWKAPLDGSQINLEIQTVQRPAGGGIWKWLSWIALAALIAWVLFSILIFVKVVQARRRRKRRSGAGRRPARHL